eukprot:448325-Pelagomonas_calceolata.AAC.1
MPNLTVGPDLLHTGPHVTHAFSKRPHACPPLQQVDVDRCARDLNLATEEHHNRQAQHRSVVREANLERGRVNELWASVRNLLQEGLSRQLLQQTGLAGIAEQVVRNRDRERTQHVLVTLRQRLEGTQPPRYHEPAQATGNFQAWVPWLNSINFKSSYQLGITAEEMK